MDSFVAITRSQPTYSLGAKFVRGGGASVRNEASVMVVGVNMMRASHSAGEAS